MIIKLIIAAFMLMALFYMMLCLVSSDDYYMDGDKTNEGD